MKIEEIERLAVAATAQRMKDDTVTTLDRMVRNWRNLYEEVLAEFIEQEKADRAKGAA